MGSLWPGRGLWALAAALTLLLGFAGTARAQTNAPESKILLTVAALPDAAEQLEAVARELLERLQMRVELRRVERIDLRELRQPLRGRHPYFARVWIAFASSRRVRLYLEHTARDRVLVRDVLSDSSNPELVREELGHILQTAVEGLIAGEEIGAPRDEALKQAEQEQALAPASPRAPQQAKPAAEPQERRPFRFGPRYEVVWLGQPTTLEDGPGAVFGYLLSKTGKLGLELGAFYRRPLQVEAIPVGARIQTLALRGLLTFDLWRGENGIFRLGAGGGADLVRVSPFAAPGADVELAQSKWLKLALGRLTLSYSQRLVRWLSLEATLGVDIAPSGTRYVFQRSSIEVQVLKPWPVRPLLSLGAAVP